MSAAIQHIGKRRSKAWWEPTFNPDLQDRLNPCNWQFANSTGPKQSFLSSEFLAIQKIDGESISFANLTFEDCDIQGYFEHSPTISFYKCRFYRCDFAHSKWVRVTFKECEFYECSIALVTFEECEFRDCKWNKIGIQGRKTSLIRCYVTNPEDFIASGFSGTKADESHLAERRNYQAYRLEESKAHLSRTLLLSHQEVGDDFTYYKTAKTHDIQQITAKIYKSYYKIRHGKEFSERFTGGIIIIQFIELFLMLILGSANGWGSTILRPIILLIISFLIFSGLYHYFCFHSSCCSYWQKSFDISAIAGYTNQVNPKQGVRLRLAEGIQLVISIVLYTIFFATVLARGSRSR